VKKKKICKLHTRILAVSAREYPWHFAVVHNVLIESSLFVWKCSAKLTVKTVASHTVVFGESYYPPPHNCMLALFVEKRVTQLPYKDC